MAISVGSRPEQVLRGVDRAVAVLADAVPQAPPRSRRDTHVPARWLIERGDTRVRVSVNLLGGFPGSLRSMNRLERSSLIVTSRYLSVGEGTAHGFALPMRDVLAATVVRPSRRMNTGLRIWYRDGQQTGSFFLDIRGIERCFSGATRADQVMQVLADRGVAPAETSARSVTPAMFMTWDEARDVSNEKILWVGNGTGPVGGWFGSRRDHCRIWVTSESLLWAGANQFGLNRIALTDIVKARDGIGDGVCIGIADELGHRFDLALDLAPDHLELDRENSPHVRMMNTLASRGVRVGSASAPLAPWRVASLGRPTPR